MSGRIIIIAAAALALAGCEGSRLDVEAERRETTNLQRYATTMLSKAAVGCRDGVQYFVSQSWGGYGTFTARLKPDGTPHLCTNKPVKFQQVPIE